VTGDPDRRSISARSTDSIAAEITVHVDVRKRP
jgi:hypothetical protein